MLKNFTKTRVVIRNILTEESKIFSNFPVYIGGDGADFKVEEGDRAILSITEEKGLFTVATFVNELMLINGVRKEKAPVELDEDIAIICKGKFLMLSIGKDCEKTQKKWLNDAWSIVDANSNLICGPFRFADAQKYVPKAESEHPEAIIHQVNSTTGLYLGAIMDLLGLASYEKPLEEVKIYPAVSMNHSKPAPVLDIDSGEFTCPYCWLRFDRGDAMHVAVHKSLQGDNLLGEEQMIRFLANNFNDRAQALDALGSPCTDLACPHCHWKLPPGFLDLKPKIFSIVGAPSSGKSYYLSVLIKMLERILYKNFQVAFYDADPAENRQLTLMKNRLFSGSTAAEAQLSKTALEGDMYVEVSRLGRKVRMPKPFVFTASPVSSPEKATSVVFYDNAGEHFEPGSNKADSPGAQHIAAAEGIFFIFDPTYNLEFRRILSDHPDPQIKDRRFDQQETLLAEMNSRVKGLLGIDFREKITTPLAVIVGKCDVWQDLVGRDRLKNSVVNGALDMNIAHEVSSLIREKLLEITPAIVANAESISKNVMYFPVSSFGCSPELLGIDPTSGHPVLSPDPTKINPILVEIPTLWILSQMSHQLIPTIAKR